MPDNEISFENTQVFRDFQALIHLRNLSLIRLMENKERVKSALLNLRLNTECDIQRLEPEDFCKN